jgi:hypothetical protein
MYPKTVRVICVIAFCVIGMCSAKAQFRQLNINDFQGQPQKGNNIAYTNCSLDFSYQPVMVRGYYQLTFNIHVVMNKNRSWLDRNRITSSDMLTEVLKHEQGHYNLAFLMQQEMLRVFGNTRFGSNYEQQVNTIFSRIKNKYQQLNNDYDEDTNHMQDRKQQNSWDLFFNQQLGQYSNLAMNREGR